MPALLALTVAMLVLAAGVGAATGQPKQAVSQTRGVRAVLSYVQRDLRFTRVRLKIVRRGKTLYDRPLRRLGCGTCPTWRPVFPGPVLVRDLDGDREPEVVVDLYSGGAHCCAYTLIYRLAGRRYAGRVAWWGNQGYRLARLDRDPAWELSSRDDRFSSAFTAYAASATPLRIFRFQSGRLVDVTRAFPAQVARDATALWREYLRVRRATSPEVRGILAAWLADKYLLGEEGDGWRRLETVYRRGELGRGAKKDGYPAGRAYLRKLRAFLKRSGYRS